ncbi:MAG: hypothetical protein NTU84_11640 [Verrucomicrobia bacterium]|jgi:hypothetical protein|nr:hypothetical protein [Verrucomicrobiota bacterium]
MNPIDTWVDTDEVRRLAERLMSPDRQTRPNIEESGFDDAFVGFAEVKPAAPAISQVAATPPPAPAPKATVPTQTHTALAAEKSPTAPSAFHEFAAWLRQQFGASAVFVVNLDGSVLHDEGCAHLHFAARGMALNWKIRGAVKPVRLLVHAGSYLELIPLDHPQGRLILGIIVPQPINPTSLESIREKSTQA